MTARASTYRSLANLSTTSVRGRRHFRNGEAVFSLFAITSSSRIIKVVYTHLLLPLLLLHHHCVAAACSSLDVMGTHAFITKKGMLEEFHLGGPSPLNISIAKNQSIVVRSATVADHDPIIVKRILIASSSFITTGSITAVIRRQVLDQLCCHRQWLLAYDTQPAETMGKARTMERMFVVIFFGLDIEAIVIHQLMISMTTISRRSISVIVVVIVVGFNVVGTIIVRH